MNMKKAFTLIELLVVIAIIAILAAILFPVFAQAKAAAKKAAEISNYKQNGLAFNIYTTDYDDLYPLAYGASTNASGQPTWIRTLIPSPARWPAGRTEAEYTSWEVSWANSTHAYRKNSDLLKSPAGVDRSIATFPYTSAPVWRVNQQMNGTLNAYSTTAVNLPSQTPLLSQNRGTMNIVGWSTANPFLICASAGPCQFVPSSPTCNGANGTYSEMYFDTGFTQWVHGRGQIVTMTDSSTKWRSMNGPVGQRSDFRTMYWTRFSATGTSSTEWQDTNFCHTMLFMPDFDHATYGTPIEY